jgi:hypothetical protein
MTTSLLTVRVRTGRDALILRQRARQLAGLLGFDEDQRGAVAATVFEMVCQGRVRGVIRFCLRGDALQVGRLLFSLPDPSATPPREDIPWLIEVLDRLTPFKLFEEIKQQNRDLLRAIRRDEDEERRAA